MSSATLLVAERNDLVGAARIAVSVFPHVELVTAGTGELVEKASASAPSAVIVPARGQQDGLSVCRKLKSALPNCRVLVLVDDPSERDAAMDAGADDILIGAPEADAIRDRLGSLNGVSFKPGERVETPLAVQLQIQGQSYPAQAIAMNRGAMFIAWPDPPEVGTAMKVGFTPYEGKTVEVWGRVQSTSGPDGANGLGQEGALLRFVGMTTEERDAVDYLVNYYAKLSGAAVPAPAASEGNGAVPSVVSGTAKPTSSGPAADPPSSAKAKLDASSPWDQLTETSAGRALITESVRTLADVEPERLATAAAMYSKTRDTKALPGGVSGGELRGFIPRLSPAEQSAMRGTSTVAAATGDLLASAGITLKALILTERFKSITKRIHDPNVQLACEEATTQILNEAVAVHGSLNKRLSELLANANMDASRDLQTVANRLLQTSHALEKALDKYVFGAAVEDKAAPIATGVVHEHARYDRPTTDPTPATTKGRDKGATTGKAGKSTGTAKGTDKTPGKRGAPVDPDKSSWRGRAVAIVVILALIGGIAWTFRHRLGLADPGFTAPDDGTSIKVDGVSIFRVFCNPDLKKCDLFMDNAVKTVGPEELEQFLGKVETAVNARTPTSFPAIFWGIDTRGTFYQIAKYEDGKLVILEQPSERG